MTRTLLSANVGVPIALLAMLLLFLAEMLNVTGRPRRRVLMSSAVLIALVVGGLVAARFMKYT